jgi:hypothetical protein
VKSLVLNLLHIVVDIQIQNELSQSFSNLDSSSVIKDDLSWSPCLGMPINLIIHFVLQGPGGQMGEIEIQMTHAAIPQPSAASEANEMHEGKKSRVSSTRGAC